MQIGIDRRRSRSVSSGKEIAEFLRKTRIASEKYIEHRLRTDDLACRSYERHVAHVFLHEWNLFQYVVDFIRRALLFQLLFEVRKHAARDLRNEDARIGSVEFRFEGRVVFAHVAEIRRNFEERFRVESRIVFGTFEHFDDGFRRAVGRSHRHGRNGRIEDIGSRFRRFQKRRNAQARRRVRVNFDRHIDFRFDRFHEVVGFKGF